MLLLEAKNMKYQIKDRLLFNIKELSIHRNDRIGLVGRNGSGKTSLLEMLSNENPEIIKHGTVYLLPQIKRMSTTKSGGEVTQEYINKALSLKSDILLADEPTTNLDIDRIEKLEKSLKKYQGALVIVSHDREFLDELCTVIWEIKDGQLNEYPGNYSDYIMQKEVERKQQENEYNKNEKKEKQLKKALAKTEKAAQRATVRPKGVSSLEGSKYKMYYASKQKNLQKSASAIETRLGKLEKTDKPRVSAHIKMDLPNADLVKGKNVIKAENLTGELPSRILWYPATFNIKGGEKVGVIGANGTGKTTLIKKLVTKDLQLTISPMLKIGYFSQKIDILNDEESILENVQSTSNHDESLIRIILARLHFFKDDVFKNVGILSGGEKVKVAFAKIFASDINTLILDEPTNYLDIAALESLEELLKDYKGTLIFVSHDRKFIQSIATNIMTIDKQRLTLFDGTYAEYIDSINTPAPSPNDNEKRLLETKITSILSKLSIEPTEELEKEYQALIKERQKM